MGLAAATFHLSSGDATEIETASLTYFTSNDCSSGPFLPAFSTSGSSGPLTIPGSGNISLDAASVYQVAVNSTPGTTSNVNAVLVGLGDNNGTFATFTGSCASRGGYCCLPLTCSTGAGTCVASAGIQNFTLNQAAPGASISTSSPLLIQPSTTGSLVITNAGPSTATNIVATLPASLNDITQNSSNCTSVASGATCQLSFTASTALDDPTLISIQGDNTNSVFATLSVAVPWVTNGAVRAIVQDPVHQLTYIGGSFTAVGPRTGTGVPIDTTSAQPLATFPQVNGNVNAVIADGNGGWYIGGTFTNVGGVTRNNIAHISSDYTVDSTFNPNANSTVRSLAISGSTIYAGGDFTTIGGQSRNRIAALDASTGTASAWNPNANVAVNALVISGSTIYAGGTFASIGGQSRNYIAALDASTGSASAWNPNANGTVNALAINGSTVYAGGAFTTIGGQSRNRIAALDASTGSASAWNPNANNTVSALAINGSTIYAGGDFTTMSSLPASYFAIITQ